MFNKGEILNDILKNKALIDNIGPKNLLINSNFDVWQRETSKVLTTSLVYLADRWLVSGGTSGEYMSRQDFTNGQTDVPNEPKHYLRLSLDGEDGKIAQRVEGVLTLAGQTASLGFWIRTYGAINYTLKLVQNYGSGGSSADTTVIQSSVATINAWTYHTCTFDVPSVSGKTISGGDDYLEILIEFATTSGSIRFAQAQLNEGELLDYQPRTFGEELLACQRYYEKSYEMDKFATDVGAAGAVGTIGTTNGHWSIEVSYKVSKKPGGTTIKIYAPASGTLGQARNGIDNQDTPYGFIVAGSSGFSITAHTGGDADDQIYAHFTADAEL